MYLFSRPKPADYTKNGQVPLEDKNLESWKNALADYEKCKSYVLDYRGYSNSLADPKRQIRTHTCFSYCKNGDDPNFMGDDRPDCIGLDPVLRD